MLHQLGGAGAGLKPASDPRRAGAGASRRARAPAAVRAAAERKGPAAKKAAKAGSVAAGAVSATSNGAGSTAAAVAEKPAAKGTPSAAINVIPQSRWPDGIPPAMGGHYMPSGAAAPLSQSKGPGLDCAPPYLAYPDGELPDVSVEVHASEAAASAALADLVAAASRAAIDARGDFVVALSGGSLLKALRGLAGRADVDFSRWWVLFADERVVAHASADSNVGAAREALLRRTRVPANQVLAIREGAGSPAAAAAHYEGAMLDLPAGVLPRRPESGLPAIDLVLLGVGPDGHVASLFPNAAATAYRGPSWVLPVTDSPKPPAERITLTLPVINAAARVAVVATGAGKAEVVQRALEHQSLPGALPVQLVRPAAGRLTWVLDAAAAGALSPADWADRKKWPRSSVA